MSEPNPQDPNSVLYQFIDTQPEDEYPCSPDSSLSHFTIRQFVPEAITKTWPIVVTLTDHGFLNGQALRFIKFNVLTGMQQLNNKTFYVQQATADTFELWNASGYAIDGTGYTTYISGGLMVLSGPLVTCVNPSHFPPPGVPVFPPA